MSTVTEVNPRLLAPTEAGVSVWLDEIRRSLVTGGELARMVNEECLRGVTANPSIFEKAILGSTDYDEELEAMAREQLDAKAIYERLAIRDVQMAADVLADLHREPMVATGSSRSRCRPRSPTTRKARSSRCATTGGDSTGRT